MRQKEIITALIFSVFIGACLLLVIRFVNRTPAVTEVIPVETVDEEGVDVEVADEADGIAVEETVEETAALMIEEGQPARRDVDDVLLLYSSERLTSFDVNFCLIAQYYGLGCAYHDLAREPLEADVLLDARDDVFALVGISAANLVPALLDEAEVNVLETAIEQSNVNLFVSKLNDFQNSTLLAQITESGLVGATKPTDNNRDWFITNSLPELTREFSGQTIAFEQTDALIQEDFAITIADDTHVTELVQSTDGAGESYALFAMWQNEGGGIFVDAGEQAESLETVTLREMYYRPLRFSHILPLMFTMRYALGDEVWHNAHSYANLTIDDPPLQTTENMYGYHRFMDYEALVPEMETFNFHTTIGLPPIFYQSSEPEIVHLFRINPDRLSVAQHGNNADGYEFFYYETSATDRFPARPFIEQRRDIEEGLRRMQEHAALTGIPHEPIMIFPYGNAPAATMGLLKQNNFLANVQGAWHPLDVPFPERWDYGMYPANMDFENFPLVRRYSILDPTDYNPFDSMFALFVDRPLLLYSHAGEVFGRGINGFNPIATQINELEGELEWVSLSHILQRLYVQKSNDDGSMNVLMYANQLILTNESDTELTYHIEKEETLNFPIVSLTINRHDFPYQVEDEMLTLDAVLPAGETMHIEIIYGDID